MTLAVGTATLSFDSGDNPVFGGTGMASAFLVALQPVRLPKTSVTTLRGEGANASVTALANALADECVAMAQALVPYLIANTLVTVTVATGGLQTTTTTGNPTNAPGAPQNVLGGIT